MERNNFMSLQQCRACFILTIKYFTKFFHCFLPCKCRTMDDVLRNLSLNITQALSKDTRFLHLLQMHSPSWLTQLFATQTKCPCAPSFLTRHIQSGAFLMPQAQGKDWELPECKCLPLCANAWRKATLVPTHTRAKSQAVSFGKTINQLGQVAKTEAICLMEENPAGIRDLIREAWVYILYFSSSE